MWCDAAAHGGIIEFIGYYLIANARDRIFVQRWVAVASIDRPLVVWPFVATAFKRVRGMGVI